MKALTVLRGALRANSGFMAIAKGGVYLNVVPQDALRPNALLMQVGGGEGFSHSGRDNLFRELVRVELRGDDEQGTSMLADAGYSVLQGYVGSMYGATVYLVMHSSRITDYQQDTDIQVQRVIDQFWVHYSLDGA